MTWFCSKIWTCQSLRKSFDLGACTKESLRS